MNTKEHAIQQAYDRTLWQIEHSNPNEAKELSKLLDNLKSILLGEVPVPANFREIVIGLDHNYLTTFLTVAISHNYQFWSYHDPIIQSLIRPANQDLGIYWLVNRYIFYKLISSETEDADNYLDFLQKQGFTKKQIVEYVLENKNHNTYFRDIYYNDGKSERKLTSFAKLLLKLLKENKNILGISFGENYIDLVNKAVFDDYNSSSLRDTTLEFLYEYYPQGLEGKYEKYISHSQTYDNKTILQFNLQNALFILNKDAQKHEEIVLNTMFKAKSRFHERFSIYAKLNESFPDKYQANALRLIEEYMNTRAKSTFYGDKTWNMMYDSHTTYEQTYYSLSVAMTKFLLKYDTENAHDKIHKYVLTSDFLYPEFIQFLSIEFKENSLEYLGNALQKSAKYVRKEYFSRILVELEKYNFQSIEDKVWDFAENHIIKANRILAAQTLSKLGDVVFERAKGLLNAKTADSRITGALVLSYLNTNTALNALKDVIDTEKNDDTRDIILDTLSEQLYGKKLTLSQLQELIQKAEKRGKLGKFTEKWVDESTLPKLFWEENGTELNQSQIRFLFYRMARSKGLNSDIEARQVINALDKSKCGEFAKKLVQAFSESGYNTKLKYYLTTGGQMGGNEILPILNTIFRKSMEEKRYKMAEYSVEAMAMVGTNKALRSVEVISRKFASKRPSVSDSATQALEAAAQELNITADELADRIVPDFGFDGLFKLFEVGGDEYRAFINADFNLCFFDEDNKMRKSIPKDTPSDLKKEFKEIEKEIRDIVKSQSGRLEKYLTEARFWDVEQWQTFFLQNPIMFVYAMKLLWGVFDENDTLKNVFYCSDDTSLYDENDEEITLNQTDTIRILHPIYLTTDQLIAWKDKIYKMGFNGIFPQLERKVFRILDEEKDKSYTRMLANMDIPKGADFVASTIEKYGWIKSNGDGGRTELTKKFKQHDVKASVNIEGLYAWYQGGTATATVRDIYFMGKDWQDKITLKDIPPIFYSEVIADIDKLIQAT